MYEKELMSMCISVREYKQQDMSELLLVFSWVKTLSKWRMELFVSMPLMVSNQK